MPIDLILDQMEIKDNGVYTPIIAAGTPGAVFIPSVSSTGIVSWTNDGGLPNPESVNIKGPQGATGPQGPQGETGTTGPAGPGVPSGGSTGQVLKKQSATDYDSAWGTDNTVIISDTQPSASDNKLWVDTDSSNGDNYLIPTMADMNAANAAQDANIGIVQTGSTATQNITKGQYVIWNGALYTASSAIASGATLSNANLTAVTGGGLNHLQSQDTGWVNITNGGTIKARKKNGLVIIIIDQLALGSPGTYQFDLPAQFMPSVTVNGFAREYDTLVSCWITIWASSGQLRFSTTTTTEQIGGFFVYFA